MDVKKISSYAFVVVAFGVLAAVAWRFSGRPASASVHYPYVCDTCRAVFDVSELKEPGMWRIAPGGGSDSVVICTRCNKGKAYPVNKCEDCGTEYILHKMRGTRCPKCHPEVAEAAKKAGVEILFKRP